MLLKVILFVLGLTIVGCFYSQSNQILDLENKVESLESDIKTVNEILDEFDEVFILLIEEIRKQTYHNFT